MMEETVTSKHYNDKCSICGKWLSIDDPLEYYSPAFCNDDGKEVIVGRCCFKKTGRDIIK